MSDGSAAFCRNWLFSSPEYLHDTPAVIPCSVQEDIGLEAASNRSTQLG